MHKSVHADAKRVLVVGVPAGDSHPFADFVLAHEGMLIIMEENAERAATIGADDSSKSVSNRTVITGDPRRFVYKLAGPFDVIFCSGAYVSLRPQLEKLLAVDGVFLTDGK